LKVIGIWKSKMEVGSWKMEVTGSWKLKMKMEVIGSWKLKKEVIGSWNLKIWNLKFFK